METAYTYRIYETDDEDGEPLFVVIQSAARQTQGAVGSFYDRRFAEAYVNYRYACDLERTLAHSSAMWLVHGTPARPTGQEPQQGEGATR